MEWSYVLIALVAILVIVAISASLKARKLDALHKNVTKSRVALENALLARSQAATELALAGAVDMAGSILLADVANEAREAAIYPIVDDGLDRIKIRDAEGNIHGGGPIHAEESPDRLNLESELSRVLRLTVDELDSSELGDNSGPLERLNETRDSVRMTRRFHNIHVAQARRERRKFLARTFRLQGSAPAPRTVDLDDE